MTLRKIIVSTLVTLDGVIEDPGGMGAFTHGGWANRYFNEEAAKRSLERLLACDYFLCGRRTYEVFSNAWPRRSGPYAHKLNSMPKLVASTTLPEPLTWNARLVKGDVAQELKKIKEQVGRDIVMYGSPVLMRSLLQHGLIDQLDLMICPIVIGVGQRLFGEGTLLELKSAGYTDLASGVVILSYQPEVLGEAM
jgi:dihydrofolate reductase